MTSTIIPPDSDNLKRCSKCHEWKPREAFYVYRAAKDGLQLQCIACQRAYRDAHLAEKVAYNREWKRQHPERAKANARRGTQAYRDRNRELVREKDKEFKRKLRLERPEYVRAVYNRYKVKRLAAPGFHTTEDLAAIRAAQTDKKGRLICWRCGKPIKGTPHIDHWIPLARGGTNDPGNLRYMHAKCNQTKSAKMPEEIGRLI